MTLQLAISDQRMLELIDKLLASGKIETKKQFCEYVTEHGHCTLHQQHIHQVTTGKQRFKIAHIEAICKIYNVNANWIMGLEKNIFRDKPVNKIVNTKTTKSTKQR